MKDWYSLKSCLIETFGAELAEMKRTVAAEAARIVSAAELAAENLYAVMMFVHWLKLGLTWSNLKSGGTQWKME